MKCLVCVLFLKISVCKDDEIPAFSAMMKMGLNCLHLTNWFRERNIFGLFWSPCVILCLTRRFVMFRGV